MSNVQDMTKLAEPPVLDIDPYSDEVLTNPYPFFEQVRETAPVVFIKPHGFYAVGRFDEAQTVASDYSRFSVEGGVGLSDIRKPGAWRPPSPISEVDPPDHSAVRGALQKVLSPLVIRKWREAFAAEAEVVADRIVEMGEFDGVRDVAEAFVLTVFPRLVGINAHGERLKITGELNFNQLGANNERLRRALEAAEPILGWYDEQLKRENLLPGSFGDQIYQAEDRGEFAKGTAAAQVRSFFRAGVDTTMAGIGFALNQLAQNPEQFEMVREDPSRVKNAFEEALRFESPAQLMFRTTTNEVELSGFRLRPDTKIAYYIGAANRDPRRWSEPDCYDITRDVLGKHLAFGHGPHLCIGMMIARQEAECILGALVKRIKRLELTDKPTYRLVNALRTLDTLPLRIELN